MKLLKTSIHNNHGLTLIEILVVLGIFSIIVALGASFGLGTYQAYLFNTEYRNISKLLAQARNEAANNFDEATHGIYIDTDSYAIFIGDTYVATDPTTITFERSDVVHIAGASEIIFEQLSGNLKYCDATPCEISFSFEGRTKTITVNDVGGITW